MVSKTGPLQIPGIPKRGSAFNTDASPLLCMSYRLLSQWRKPLSLGLCVGLDLVLSVSQHLLTSVNYFFVILWTLEGVSPHHAIKHKNTIRKRENVHTGKKNGESE